MTASQTNRSLAFAEFVRGWHEITTMLQVAPKPVEQLRNRSRLQLASALYRGCVVLLSSHLERYIESLVVEVGDAINQAKPSIDQLPMPLRVVQIEQTCFNAFVLFDENRRSRKKTSNGDPSQEFKEQHIQKLKALRKLVTDHTWFWNDKDLFDKVKVDMLITGFANPSPDKIRELFWYFGIDDIIACAVAMDQKVDNFSIANKVAELIHKRNEIAHTSQTSSLTLEDVVTYMRCVRRLARGIDHTVGAEMQQAIGIWPWSTAILPRTS